MSNELTIGKLATAAGVNVETIRYYQRRGLLTEPVRPAGGQRRYSPNDARRVRFIKRAQVLGFTLEEVGSLLTLEEATGHAVTAVSVIGDQTRRDGLCEARPPAS